MEVRVDSAPCGSLVGSTPHCRSATTIAMRKYLYSTRPLSRRCGTHTRASTIILYGFCTIYACRVTLSLSVTSGLQSAAWRTSTRICKRSALGQCMRGKLCSQKQSESVSSGAVATTSTRTLGFRPFILVVSWKVQLFFRFAWRYVSVCKFVNCPELGKRCWQS